MRSDEIRVARRARSASHIASLVILAAVLFVASGSMAWAQPAGAARAYGEKVDLKVKPPLLLGLGVQVTSGPLPVAQGDHPPFSQDAILASIRVALGNLGEVLRTGILVNHAEGTADGRMSASSTVNQLRVSLLPVQPLLTLQADTVRSSAEVRGSCGALTAVGSTALVNAGVGGVLGLGLSLSASPAPNTVLLDLLGIRVVLNEQIVGGDGIRTRSLAVNAIHISIKNALLIAIGGLSGDVVIAHSEASRECAEPTPDPEEADLRLTLGASPDPVPVGGLLIYSLTVTNDGPSEAFGVVLTDVLPPEVTLLSVQSSQGACSEGGTLVCDLGEMPAGAAALVSIEVQPDAAGIIVDTASVTSLVHDPNLSNNQASVTVTVEEDVPGPQADLELVVRSEGSSVVLGESFTFILQVTNSGPEDAASVVVAEVIPAGADFVSASPSQGSCTAVATLVCDLGDIAFGERASITIVLRPHSLGEASYEWIVTSSMEDPDSSNNSDRLELQVTEPSPDP